MGLLSDQLNVIFSVSALTIPVFLFGQSPEIVDLEPFVIHENSIGTVGSDLFDSSTIDGFRSVEDSLQMQSGVFLNNATGHSLPSELIVRGGEGNFVRFEINGLEINDPNDSRGSGINLNTLAALNFKQFQLQKGTLSSQDGSGAMAGKLNLIPGLGFEQGMVSTLEVGSQNLWKAFIGGGADFENSSIEMGYGTLEENGLYDGHQFESKAAFVSGDLQFHSKVRAGITVLGTQSNQIRLPDDSGGILYAVAPSAFQSSDMENLGIIIETFIELESEGQLGFKIGRYENESNVISPGVPGGERNPFGIPASESFDTIERYQLSVDYTRSVGDSMNLSLGVEGIEESASSEGELTLFPGFSLPTSYDVSRYKRSASLTIDYQLTDSQQLLLAGRYDNVESFDDEQTFGIKFSNEIDAINGSVFLKYSEGFKAPSIYALNSPLIGNEELVPETGQTYEAGVQSDLSERLSLSAVLFQQKYSNLVDYSEVSQSLVNLNSVDIVGVELEMSAQLSDTLRWATQLTHMNLNIEDDNEILRNRPELQLASRLIWYAFVNQNYQLSYRYIGERWDSSIPTGNVKMEGVHELNVSWYFQPNDNTEISVEIQNLLNQREQVLVGYKNPGTAVIGTLRFHW